MPLNVREVLAGLLVGGIAVSAGRPAALDSTTIYVPSVVAVGSDVWSTHAPTTGGRAEQLGWTVSGIAPGPVAAVATVELRAAGVAVCAVSIPCDGTPGQHAHVDCSGEVGAEALVTAHVASSGCTGAAVPSGLLTFRSRWR